MKKITKYLSMVLCLCILLSMATVFASAQSTFPNVLGGKLENGLTGIRYYYSSSFDEEMATAVETAVDDWTWAVNESAVMQDSNLYCSFAKMSSPYDSLHIQFVESSSLDAEVISKVSWYNDDGEVDPTQFSWTFCLVEINPTQFAGLTERQQRITLNHALGQVLGLRDNFEDNGVIMWWNLIQIGNIPGTSAHVPTAEDLRNIRYLYE